MIPTVSLSHDAVGQWRDSAIRKFFSKSGGTGQNTSPNLLRMRKLTCPAGAWDTGGTPVGHGRQYELKRESLSDLREALCVLSVEWLPSPFGAEVAERDAELEW